MSAFTSTSGIFEGDELTDWLVHFKLSHRADFLQDLGVNDLEDLGVVCQDEDLVSDISNEFSKTDFARFKIAIKKTKQFEALDIISSITRSEVRASKVTDAVDATLLAEDPEVVAMKELVAKLKSENEEMNEKMKLKEKSHTLSKLRAEVEELEKATVLRKSYMKEMDIKKMKESEEKLKLETKIRRTKEKKTLLQNLEINLREAASLDICFLIDLTGSMSPHKNAVQQHIVTILDSLQTIYVEIPVRLSCVGYRDHCDGDKRIAIHKFSSDVETFRAMLRSQGTSGGGDAPEDIAGGLKSVIELEWRSATRILVHIGDAPCHGSKYHDLKDDYPSGDPNGLVPESLLNRLTNINVVYMFGRINSSTDKMIAVFNTVMPVETFEATKADSMMDTVSKSITSSVSSSISASSSTEVKIEAKDLVMDTAEPKWDKLKYQSVHKYEIILPTSVADLISSDDSTKCVSPVPVVVQMKIASLPFAKGSCRAAYMAIEQQGGTILHTVHKVSLSNKEKDLTRQKYESSSIRTQAAAIYLSNAFNAAAKSFGYPVIRMSNISLLQYLESDGVPYCTQEDRVLGNWEKYNNNHGLVTPNPTPCGTNHDIIQAFSHWTYHITDGKMLVVDCQGSFRDRVFYLTDPAIHCTDVTRFGGTNLGTIGISRFLLTHKCNECCRALSIPAHTM